MDEGLSCPKPASGPAEFEAQNGQAGWDDQDGRTWEHQECDTQQKDSGADNEDDDASDLAQAQCVRPSSDGFEKLHASL